MARYRKLPSGLWQATVDLPSGKRITDTYVHKAKARAWATEQEAKLAAGHRVNPRGGRIIFANWVEAWLKARVVEDETRRIDASAFKLHILPYWVEWRLGDIGRIDVQTWVRTLEQEGVGRAAIRRSYNLVAALLGDAAADALIGTSPCQRIDLPATPPKAPAWFTRAQVDLIEAELPRGHAAMTELMVYTGLRWGETAGVAGADRDDETGNPIDWLRRTIKVRGTVSQYGRWKKYPKNISSCREVPVPPHVLEILSPLLLGRAADAWVFVTQRRSPGSTERGLLSANNWRRTWGSAINAANAKIEAGNEGLPPGERRGPVPRYTPHDCRHTAASWLVQAGVPLYDVQKLLGHASFATTQRYAHLAPDAHSVVEDAWVKIVAHEVRIRGDR